MDMDTLVLEQLLGKEGLQDAIKKIESRKLVQLPNGYIVNYGGSTLFYVYKPSGFYQCVYVSSTDRHTVIKHFLAVVLTEPELIDKPHCVTLYPGLNKEDVKESEHIQLKPIPYPWSTYEAQAVPLTTRVI